MIGLKLVCECKAGDVNTWHDVLETTIEDVINKWKHNKTWMGGKFLEAYLEFHHNDKYYRVDVDIKKMGLNKLLVE